MYQSETFGSYTLRYLLYRIARIIHYTPSAVAVAAPQAIHTNAIVGLVMRNSTFERKSWEEKDLHWELATEDFSRLKLIL